MNSRRRSNSVVCLLVALLALPALPLLGTTPSSSTNAFETGHGATLSYVPAVLGLPFAVRAGFDPGHLGAVESQSPTPDATVLVTVTLAPRDPSFFTPRPFGLPPLTADQVRTRYAPLPADYDALQAYFLSHGLTTVHEWPDGLALTVTGSASAAASAFGTTLRDGLSDGRPVRFAATAPSLPAALQAEVAAVSGLDSGFSTFSLPFHAAPLAIPSAARTTGLITPSSLHKVYELNGLYNYSGSPHWATGVGIALVLWGQGYAPSDLQTFFSSYYPTGFPAVTVRYLAVDGAPAPSEAAVNDPSNVTSEMTLDMEWAGSAAPGATLIAVYAPDGPASNNYSPSDAHLEDALHDAIQFTNASVVSMSFGTPDGSDPPFQAAMEIYLGIAQNQGITVLAASGDTGGDLKVGCHGGPSPEYPASSQFVVAAGGTAPVLALDPLGQVTGLDSEPAWNRSGGGYAVAYPAPGWQEVGSAAAPITAHGHRGIPDVAGPASDNLFYYHGQPAAGAGTSFAAPLWAGIIAEMDAIRGTPFGLVTPRIYSVGAAEAGRSSGLGLVDTTAGSNCLGAAGTGWDTATGWGSPRGLALYQELAGTFVNVTLTVSSDPVTPGSSFDAIVHVTNLTTHAPIAGASVTYELIAVNYVGPCGGSLDLAGTQTLSDGSASSSMSIPSCFLGTRVELTATVSGGAYFGTNTTTLTVNLIGLAGFLAIIQQFPYNVLAFVGIVAIAVLIGWRVGLWRDRRERARRARSGPPRPGPMAANAGPRGPAPGGSAARPAATGPPSARTSPTPPGARPAVARVAVAPTRPGPPATGRPPAPSISTRPVVRPSPPMATPAPREAAAPAPQAGEDPEYTAADIPTVPDHVASTPTSPPPPLSAASTVRTTERSGGSDSAPAHAYAVGEAGGSRPDRTCASCGASVPWTDPRCPVCGTTSR